MSNIKRGGARKNAGRPPKIWKKRTYGISILPRIMEVFIHKHGTPGWQKALEELIVEDLKKGESRLV